MKRIVIAVLPAAWLVRGAGATFAANPGTQVSQGKSTSARPRRLSQADPRAQEDRPSTRTGGIAGSVYAGNRIAAMTVQSAHAVSQYDVACFQVSQK